MIVASAIVFVSCAAPESTAHFCDVRFSATASNLFAEGALQASGPAGEPGSRSDPGQPRDVGPVGPERSEAAPEAERAPVADQPTREQAELANAELNREPHDAHLAEHQLSESGLSFGLQTSFVGLGISDNQGKLGGTINVFGLNELTDMVRNPLDYAKGFSLFGASPQLTISDGGDIGLGISLGGIVASAGAVMIVSPSENFGNVQLSASIFNLSVEIELTRGEIAAEYARQFELVGYDWDKY